MKILVFYRTNSEHATHTEGYIRDLQRMHDVQEQNLEVVDIDTREGMSLASLYDILAYPGLVVTDDVGGFVKSWSGELPLMDELMSYAFTY